MATFGYGRVSTTEQTTENQRMEIEQSGYKLDYWFADDGVSGAVLAAQRPRFKEMLNKLRNGETVVVTKIDRLGRDAVDIQQTVKQLKVMGIRVYAQMAPRILYALVGKEPPSEDCYAIPGLEGCRDGVKKVFNAMLYVEDMTRYPSASRKYFPRKLKVEDVMQMISNHHRPIAHMFFADYGMREMFMESEILVDVLLRLMHQNIVALPIHDSVMVAFPHADTARDIMLDVFKHHTGAEGRVTTERAGRSKGTGSLSSVPVSL